MGRTPHRVRLGRQRPTGAVTMRKAGGTVGFMADLIVDAYTITLDGFAAGLDQSLEHPLGRGFDSAMEWAFATKAFRELVAEPELVGDDGPGEEGVDNDQIERSLTSYAAGIMGRNMFGPVRGEWSTWGPEPWVGWWGPNPPYHYPVFVVTHHQRPPLAMEGGTTFHFVPSLDDAYRGAMEAADGGDVRVSGGARTIRQLLDEHRIERLHLAIVPLRIGDGERIFDTTPDSIPGYSVTDSIDGERATHVTVERD